MAHDRRVPIVTTPFRTVPSLDGRSRTVFLQDSRRGRSVKVESYDKDGRQLAGTLLLFPDDFPAFLAALTEAAAAIGVEIPAPQPAGAALARNLPRARAL